MPLTEQQILDAEEDLRDLGDIVNGPADMDVMTRTGGAVPTIKKVLAPHIDVATAVAAAEAAEAAAVPAAATATEAAAALESYQDAFNPTSAFPDHLFEWLDARGRIIAFITTLNVLVVSSLQAVNNFFIGTSGRAIADNPDPISVFSAVDAMKRVFMDIRSDGRSRVHSLRAKRLTTDYLNGITIGSYQTLFSGAPILLDNTTREIVISNGQSLSMGAGATNPGDGSNPPIALTTDQPYANLMPEGGVRPFLSADPTPFGALVPHIEAADVPNSAGETVLGGFQAMLAQLLNRCGYSPTDHSLRTVSYTTGQGETAIAAFRQAAGGLFARITDSITALLATIGGGQVTKMRSMLWLQGESDVATTQAAYAAHLTGLAGEVDVAVRALTGQADPVVTIVGQLERPKIGLGQQDAARSSRLVTIAGPTYWVEWAGLRGVNFDDVHRSAEGYKRMGACFAVAWFCTNILKRPWRPLQLRLDARGRLDCQVDGADLIVRYEVPHGGALCIDTFEQVNGGATAPLYPVYAPQKGFYLFDDDGVTEKLIGDVVIESRNQVRLVGCNPVANDILRVGFKDPTSHAERVRVNLRDRQGEIITFDDLGGLPVHNWAVAEQHQLTAEELA